MSTAAQVWQRRRPAARGALAALLLAWPVLLPAAAVDGLLADLGRARPPGFVADRAGVFPETARQELDSRLADFERQTTAEIAVVALPDIAGGDIADFGARLFRLWGIGKQEKNNGVLLLAALRERQVRIEVGYGLEGVLPDAVCGRILDETVLPALREGQVSLGLERGARALMDRIQPATGADAAPAVAAPRRLGLVGWLLVLGFVGIMIGLMVLAHKRGWTSHSAGGGGFGGGGGYDGGFGGGSSGGGGASRGW